MLTRRTAREALSSSDIAERLRGERPRNAEGIEVDPGDALPFDATGAPPTMLQPRELNYLHWLASSRRGTGRTVELGCFLGGSTAALVDGMRVRHGGSDPLAQPLLVYDSFDLPADSPTATSWWMKPFGLTPGESFLPRFKELHAHRLRDLSVREGWLPENADEATQRALYPEQEPIDLLFVDAAKTWATHLTILRTFARHCTPGSVLVQQDFMDILPCLSVHMWQLRDCFVSLDLVRGTPMLSFECVADPNDALDRLWSTPHEASKALVRDGAWSELNEYWRTTLSVRAAGVLDLHRFVLSAQTGSFDDACAAAERYEDWSVCASSLGCYVAPAWAGWLRSVATAGRAEPGAARRAATVLALHTARAHVPSAHAAPGSRGRDLARESAWLRVSTELAAKGKTRVALFGAGRHTEWLLGPDGPLPRDASGVEIVCVIDDAPSADSVRGVPIKPPQDVDVQRDDIDAVVASSDAHEAQILRRIHECFGSAGIEGVALYGAECRDAAHDPAAQTENSAPPVRPSRAPTGLATTAEYREALGLSPDRPWLDRFARAYRTPDWATGFVNHRDALLLWDLVEATRPKLAVEVGVASGVSTRMLAEAIAHFSDTNDNARVLAVDLDERCYFDRDRAIGGVLDEEPCSPGCEVEILTGASALDAARRCAPRSIELAFIDGDHRHPAPTLDLLALLPALRPGAWVALHDIELPAIAERLRAEFANASGAQRLFHAWPGETARPNFDDPTLNNIGAVRLPEEPNDVVPTLLALLREPWENGAPSPDLEDALELALPSVTTRTPGASRTVTT